MFIIGKSFLLSFSNLILTEKLWYWYYYFRIQIRRVKLWQFSNLAIITSLKINCPAIHHTTIFSVREISNQIVISIYIAFLLAILSSSRSSSISFASLIFYTCSFLSSPLTHHSDLYSLPFTFPHSFLHCSNPTCRLPFSIKLCKTVFIVTTW